MTPTQARVLERAAVSPDAYEPGTCHDPGHTPWWGPGQLPRRHLARALTVLRREWVATLFGLSAIFAAITAPVTINPPERLWGELAAVSYAAAAVLAAVARRRGATLAVLVSLAGAVLAPLAWMASTRLGQPEVYVIIRSAKMLVHTGTPYASPAALAAAHNWMAYDPYLPALIVFGVPRALGGGLLTDPRLWFGAAFVITFGAALRVARVPRPGWWTVLVIASPVVALPLAVGGDDLPVLGLVCLGLALADRAVLARGDDPPEPPDGHKAPVTSSLAPWPPARRDEPPEPPDGHKAPVTSSLAPWPPARRDEPPEPPDGHKAPVTSSLAPWPLARRDEPLKPANGQWQWQWPVAAGLALGLAAAMKATAWPALAVAAALLACRGGWRAIGWFAAAVAGVVVVTDGPVVAADPAATVANTMLYPLGLTKITSPAASQLPGHILASAGTWGHLAALSLMAVAGAGVAASLIIRPPADAQAAGWRLVLGLTLLFGLAPASRVGYFVYPLGLTAWLLLRAKSSRSRERAGRPEAAAEQPHELAETAAGQPRELSVDPVPAFGRETVTHVQD